MRMRKRPAALVLAAATLLTVALGSGMTRAGDRNFFLPEEETEEGYERYENTAVCFALDVPEEYEVTEPYENVAMIADGDDFRLSAEYAWYTAAEDHFIRSAEDFAALIQTDAAALTDWIGTDELEVIGSGWGDVDGTDVFTCAFTLSRSGKDYSGALYIFGGQGDFGCYCMQALLNEGSSKADLYAQQLEHMVRSFAVTGPYQAEGYTLCEMESKDVPVSFLVRETARTEQFTYVASVIPEDATATEACVSIGQTVYDADHDLETVLDSLCGYYFNNKDDARFTAQPSHFDLGQYSYDMVEMEYADDGEHYALSMAVFVTDGMYWEVDAETCAEYADATAAVFSDVLFSLRVNGDDIATPASSGGQMLGVVGGVGEVLDATEAQEGFTGGGADGWMEPLGFVAELDNGGRLLLTEYEMQDGNMTSVYTDAWYMSDGMGILLARNELYQEVGGNSGAVSLVRKDGQIYMLLESQRWEGDSFNDYYAYMLWNEDQGGFEPASSMEAHGTVGQEDQGLYAVDGQAADRAAFDGARAAYSVYIGPMDIVQGHGNGDVMDFAALRQWYPD